MTARGAAPIRAARRGPWEAVLTITDLAALQLRVEQIENVFDGTQDVLIVQATTDTGLTGFGEVVSSSYVARAAIQAPRSGAGRHGLRELVRGQDPLDPASVWRVMYEGTSWYGRRGTAIHAMAGVDVALWDLKAKHAGKPLYQVLEPSSQPRLLPAYASVLWGDTIAETERLARELRDYGFRAVKFGFGPIGSDLQQDIAMVGAARRALGDDLELMVDVGRRWTLTEATARAHAFADFNVRWLEEPLHPDDLEGYRQLTAVSPIPIAGAETEETVEQFRAFLDAGVKVVQPDLGRVGLTQALQISAMAREYGARCVPHCFGSGINTTASIHWMLATGGDLVEYPMRANALCRNLVSGVPPLEDGGVRASGEPGLGIQLNPAVIDQYEYV
jgi:L-alanine-DL-glutamate epimerase-like enolase superfamily enzyme